jgi:hypothetical protein
MFSKVRRLVRPKLGPEFDADGPARSKSPLASHSDLAIPISFSATSIGSAFPRKVAILQCFCAHLRRRSAPGCGRAVGTTAGIFSRPEADVFLQQNDLKIETL